MPAAKPRPSAARAAARPAEPAHSGKADAGKTDAGKTAEYNIAAVDRALDLLESLARIAPATLAALADDAGCTRTAAFRLLRTLEARGFAVQDEARGQWRLGARWAILGRAAQDQGALVATANAFMAELGQATGETVELRGRDGLESETLAVFQPDPALRLYTSAGERKPLHAGVPRLLLAYAPEAVQTQMLAQRLPRFTPATRTDPAWIAADLQRIRSRGYLVTSDEVSPGAVSVAAPVFDASGQVVAALSVTAPSLRMRAPRPRALLAQVQETAVRLSRRLGATVPDAPPYVEPKTRASSAPRPMLASAPA
jgi:DNA-binding IclR family transcriptional regulator